MLLILRKEKKRKERKEKKRREEMRREEKRKTKKKIKKDTHKLKPIQVSVFIPFATKIFNRAMNKCWLY